MNERKKMGLYTDNLIKRGVNIGMNKGLLKILIILCFVITLFSTNSVESNAMAKWVQASYREVKGNSDNTKVWGYGYVTAEKRHYANVRLYEFPSASIVAESGRRWGTGQVIVSTEKVNNEALTYGVKIFYGSKDQEEENT